MKISDHEIMEQICDRLSEIENMFDEIDWLVDGEVSPLLADELKEIKKSYEKEYNELEKKQNEYLQKEMDAEAQEYRNSQL